MRTPASKLTRHRCALAVAIAAFLLVFACATAGATSSIHFPGSNSYASTPDSPAFDFPGSFTIELQFRSAGPHTGTLVAKFRQASGTPNDDSYHLYIRDDDTLQARIQTTLLLADLKAGGPIHDGEWHHVALVFDNPADRAELYLDGELKTSQTLTGDLRDTAERVTIGCVLSGAGPTPVSFFAGEIDELRFWNTARRGEQAVCLRTVTLLEQTPGLVSYYRFDEGSGTATADLIAPYEPFTLFSGTTFSTAEPPLLSRLSGPGQCRCGEVSGVLTQAMPAVTLVGDTVTVPANDSLVLLSHSLTVDSSVTVVRILGSLRAAGTVTDSARILGQNGPASLSRLDFLGSAATSLRFMRVSGFAAPPLRFVHSLSMENCVLSDCGGGIESSAAVTITDSRFAGNTAVAIRSVGGALTIRESEFTANATAIRSEGAVVILDSVEFLSNSSTDSGIVDLRLETGSARIEHCTFLENSATLGGAIFALGDLTLPESGDSLIVRHCTFTRNSTGAGGAIWAADANLRFEYCQFDSNAADTGGAVLVRATPGHVCRLAGDSLTFTGNRGGEGSALALRGTTGGPVELRLVRSLFAGNESAPGRAGAAICGERLRALSGPILERCLFFDNRNPEGATAALDLRNAVDGTPVELRNLTVVLNEADSSAVALCVPAVVRNCIVSENFSLRQITGNHPAVAYCLTSDSEYHGAGGSFDDNPQFADFWGRDFRLTAGSPCINRGDPNPLYNDPDGTRADIGCFPCEPFPPVWQSISDVPHDNGRQLMLQWLPSAGDDSRRGIASYAIYRVVNLSRLDENYELMVTVPAAQLPGYGQIVPTLADSNSAGVPYYRYFIRAQSANPLAFWDTPEDSGYSVDNIAPGSPLLSAEPLAAGISLIWTAAPDSDLTGYELFRSDAPFDPDTSVTVFASVSDTAFLDSVTAGTWYYAVRAVDRNSNRSLPSNVVVVDLTAAFAPSALTIMPLGNWLWLRWQAAPGAVFYRVYRESPFGGPLELVGTTTESYFLTPLTGSSGFFRVTAER